MNEDGSTYYGGADGHFNQEGLYTGEGGEYHPEMDQNYNRTYREFPSVEEWESPPWLLALM